MARRYKDFPIYNASTGILDGVTLNLPIFFIITSFSPEIAGFYALLIRVLNAPIAIISAAVSKVNLKKIVDLVNDGKRADRYLLKLSAVLLAISLPPSIVFMIWGPPIFSFVFGEEWIQAGKFSQVLALSLAVKFVSSTLSSTLGATNNNRYSALWRTVAFTSTLLVLGFMARSGSIENFIWALVINEICIYSFYFYLIFLAARNPRN
jgi:O-antigen/teichoic acid export membrane protein